VKNIVHFIGKYTKARQLNILVKSAVKNKVVQIEIKLSSGKNLSQSQSKMVKNFISDAEMTELLPFK
jgi:hypothetical protein